MKKKIIPAMAIIFITVLGGIFFFEVGNVDRKVLSETFSVNAVYFESEGIVEISFEDRSEKTNKVTLEILGMEESYQKTFVDQSFVERVSFPSIPQYGWKVHPITLDLNHQEFGRIGIKTEIHSPGDPTPPIIYSTP